MTLKNYLVHVMFHFSKEAIGSVCWKEEKESMEKERISVQSTAKVWRRYENVGRGVASYGRKEKETAKRSQMCVGPDDDDGSSLLQDPH